MDASTIVAIIQAGAQIAKAVAPLIQSGKVVFSTEDEAKIKEALEQIQGLNDAAYERVINKLG